MHVSHIMNQQCHFFLGDAFALIKNPSFAPLRSYDDKCTFTCSNTTFNSMQVKNSHAPALTNEGTFRLRAIARDCDQNTVY